jgi:hypothetical protein
MPVVLISNFNGTKDTTSFSKQRGLNPQRLNESKDKIREMITKYSTKYIYKCSINFWFITFSLHLFYPKYVS